MSSLYRSLSFHYSRSPQLNQCRATPTAFPSLSAILLPSGNRWSIRTNVRLNDWCNLLLIKIDSISDNVLLLVHSLLRSPWYLIIIPLFGQLSVPILRPCFFNSIYSAVCSVHYIKSFFSSSQSFIKRLLSDTAPPRWWCRRAIECCVDVILCPCWKYERVKHISQSWHTQLNIHSYLSTMADCSEN